MRESTLPEYFPTAARFSDMPSVLYAWSFPRWKHPVLRQCFAGRKLVFATRREQLPAVGWLLSWGMMPLPESLPDGLRVLRMEDGFLRSVGLGADLVRPISWVVDGQGIYYDATRPSDLETILTNVILNDAMRERARQLRLRIVAKGLTKYNVGNGTWQRPNGAKKVILVPGQVESDASLAYGAPGERTNMGLLRAVRAANPDAWLVYKPHPDVLARLRLAGSEDDEANRWCDEVVAQADMGAMLAAVDEVHVMTSLAGFEALLREKPVVCHGQPFYSGWGLTRDMLPVARRQRRLTLDELVAGVLMDYPLYLSRDGRHLLTPEAALDTLAEWRRRSAGRTVWWREGFRMILRRVAGVR